MFLKMNDVGWRWSSASVLQHVCFFHLSHTFVSVSGTQLGSEEPAPYLPTYLHAAAAAVLVGEV